MLPVPAEAATKGRSVVSPQWVHMTREPNTLLPRHVERDPCPRPSAGGRLQVGFSTSPAKDPRTDASPVAAART